MSTDSSSEPLGARSPVGALRGIGPVREQALRDAGVESVLDLLMSLPRGYEDRRFRTPVAELRPGAKFTVVGRLSKVNTVRLYRRKMTLVRAVLEDSTGRLPVTWFNRPYLASQIEADEPYLLHGAVRSRGDHLEILNPSLEIEREGARGAPIVPVYSSLAGLGPALVRRIIGDALDAGALSGLEEPVPEELRRERGLPTLAEALERIHRPAPDDSLEELLRGDSLAHGRLVYGEMLALQTELALARRGLRALRKRHRYDAPEGVRRRIAEALPFRLTRSQTRVLDEILEDLNRPSPMMRLLQGDVGSGKTVVAGIAMAAAAESGLQSALLAPTELLAEQHYRSLRALLGKRHEVRLVTSSVASAEVREELRRGRVRICVGTHALLQARVEFERLALIVVDEQHRFGVKQRRNLVSKGEHPDLLVMTATPIPRSLAMTVYGDLAVSVIDELPPGRRPVETSIRPESDRDAVYRELAVELDRGTKAFVVLPLIEESDKVEAGAVEGLGRTLAERFEQYDPTVLHGRMDSEAKSARMASFARGDSQILIATSLIEVGVDVPEATMMVIESAERFGLAQLHQLRGRVGRGERSSRCIALHGRLSEDTRRRLETFETAADGFELAEADLEMRGPGDLLGTRQAGIPSLRLVDLIRHRHWIELARQDARNLVARREAEGEALAAEPGARPPIHVHLAGG